MPASRACTLLGAALMLLTIRPAAATNGFVPHGFGSASRAMAGVAYALPQDSFVSMSNPAGLLLVGDRADIGVEWLRPDRGGRIEGNRQLTLRSADGDFSGNRETDFFGGEAGVAHCIDRTWCWGLSVTGAGMNTGYDQNPYAGFGSDGPAGVDGLQAFVTPAMAWRVTPRLAIGAALNLVYQRLKIAGLDVIANGNGFGTYSESPEFVSDNGWDDSRGISYRLGVLFEPVEGLTVGAGGQPRTHMSHLRRYRGLLPDQGSFDYPAIYGGGVAYRWEDRLVVAVDVQRLRFDAVSTLGNPFGRLVDGIKAGSDQGPGFGWRAMTVYKIGLAWQVDPRWQLRAGYSHGRQPVPPDQTLPNIIAPGVLDTHYTVGVAYRWSPALTLSGYAVHAPARTVRGEHSIAPNQLSQPLPPASMGGGEADVHMAMDSLGVSLSLHY